MHNYLFSGALWYHYWCWRYGEQIVHLRIPECRWYKTGVCQEMWK